MARPPKFQTSEEFESVADAYFVGCEAREQVPTVNGLALALDLTRETLLRYAEKPEFSDTVKRVRTRLEAAWEQRLANTACTGAIFWLKNQGWSDKSEQVVTSTVEQVTRIELVAGGDGAD